MRPSVAYPIEMSDVEIEGVTFDASSLPKMLRPGTIDLVAGIKVTVNYGDGTSSAVADFDVYESIDGEDGVSPFPTVLSDLPQWQVSTAPAAGKRGIPFLP